MKIVAIGICAVLLGAGVYLWQGVFGENEVFILPKDYKGVVVILFNQKDGQPIEYEEGKRVYRIPQDGVLKTQFSINHGWHDLYKFYHKADGRMVEIPYIIDGRDVTSGRVQVCCFSSGKAGKDPESSPSEFAQFYVGTKEEIDNAIENGERLNPSSRVFR